MKANACLTALALLAGCAPIPRVADGPAPGQPGTPAGNAALLAGINAGMDLPKPSLPDAEALMDAVGSGAALGAKCGQASMSEAGALLTRAARTVAAKQGANTQPNLEYRARDKLRAPSLDTLQPGQPGCTNAASIWVRLSTLYGKPEPPTSRREAGLTEMRGAARRIAQAVLCGMSTGRGDDMLRTALFSIQVRVPEASQLDLASAARTTLEAATARSSAQPVVQCEPGAWSSLVADYGEPGSFAAARAEAAQQRNNDRRALASKVAGMAGWALGLAQSCYRVTPGDVRYARDLVAAKVSEPGDTIGQAEAASSFQQAADAGQRGTVGPTDYDCPRHEANARAMVVRFGGQLRSGSR